MFAGIFAVSPWTRSFSSFVRSKMKANVHGVLTGTDGIGVAVGALEAHDELPAFAGFGQCASARGFVAAVPGQRNASGHGGSGAQDAFDAEVKARAAFEGVRKAVHGADDGDVDAFLLTRQCVFERQVCAD